MTDDLKLDLVDPGDHPFASKSTDGLADTVSDAPSAEDLVLRVHNTFASNRKWGEVSPDLVREVVERLNLVPDNRARSTPRLRLQRLRFTGHKVLKDGRSQPIAYDQPFQPGVNVLLVQDNSVGKSSIFKTIKFALTGDDTDYDSDVRSWIASVWLHFTIGEAAHTVHLRRGEDDRLAGYIAAGHVDTDYDDLDTSGTVTIARMSGADSVRDRLNWFFLDRFALEQLGWTDSGRGVAEERRITWRTFFQALTIPDSSENYLLVSEKNTMGNQEGLLLSVLLGLHLAQPINELLIESQKTRSETKVSEEDRLRAEAEAAELEKQRGQFQAEMRRISRAQEARRAALTANPDARRLQELSFRQGELIAERTGVQRQRDELTTQVQRERARARSLRETAELRLHFTGLAVAVCPNCDSDVDPSAVEREVQQHHCRLCGKEAHAASPEDVEGLADEAGFIEVRADEMAAIRDGLSAQLRELDQEAGRLESEVQAAKAVLQHGPEYALPTAEEQARRDELLEEMGALRARITIARATAARSKAGGGDAELRAEIQRRVRTALQEDAARMNSSVLNRLNALTQDMVTRIGAESISDVTCSPVGTLSLQKNGVQVRFPRVNNPGERLRIKLAFFLAMMRLGRMKGAGRHPGFVMIDQPGSDEIVDADFEALGRVLSEIDQDFSEEVQIICFTARPQFASATAPERVYGAQAGEYVF
jgi:hypothetical protein